VLSSGGQGIVYMTEEPNVLLKLEWNPKTQEIEKDTSNNAKFDNIRILPLLEETNLTLPQTILKNVVGYTMKMLDGMVSFEDAFTFNGEQSELPNNEWLAGIKESNEDLGDILQKYIATGGMRKRLNAFLNASCVLAKIHASGLVYCDISGKNMFVSEDPNKSNVWLIDCDNLSFMKDSIKKRDGGLHSPGFGAPEIYANKGKTMYSDAFSFAIALFWELTMSHPFNGSAVQEALEDILDVSEEDYACMGNFAWICDEDDDSNELESGMPVDMFVSKNLFDRFQKTFSETGRKNRQKRTTMPEWSYVLAKELDHTIRCRYCNMDYYGNEQENCPWCDAENKLLKVSSFDIVDNEKLRRWDFIHELTKGTVDIPLRLLEGFCSNHTDEKSFKIECDEDGIEIGELSNGYDFFVVNENKEKQIYGSTKFSVTDRIVLSAVNKRNNNRYLLEIEVKR
jgi:serine/threonine protein kinase